MVYQLNICIVSIVLQYDFCGCMLLNQLLSIRLLDCVQLFEHIMNYNVVDIWQINVMLYAQLSSKDKL